MTTVFENHGLSCPSCGTDKNLIVEAQTAVRLLPEGIDIVADQEWDERCHVLCDACGHDGTVASFSGRKARMARQLCRVRDLIQRTMSDHVYQGREGILPSPDCEYVAALANIDALLAKVQRTTGA